MKVMALDYGRARTGVAVSDPTGAVARPLGVVENVNDQDGLEKLLHVIRIEEPERIVVGLPLLMSGERGVAAESAQQFADALSARTELPVDTYDERLTSALSERRLRELGVRTGHARARVDQGAAVALLESYLLRLQSRSRGPGA